MNFRPMVIVNTLLVAGMAAASAWAWNAIPGDAQAPVHFGFDGMPDRYAGKAEVLLMMPLLAAFVTLLMWGLPRLDPRRANIEASAKFWNVSAILSVALLAYVHALFVLNATMFRVDVTAALVPALSILLIGIGNYLGKTRSNWFGGVRTPWTMSSDYSWQKTHHWAGRLFVASGILGLVAWSFLGAQSALVALIGALVASSFISVALSYIFWRADPERAANGTP